MLYFTGFVQFASARSRGSPLRRWVLALSLTLASSGGAEESPQLFGPADAPYERAGHFLREGDVPAALLEVEDALRRAPDSPKILRRYARILVLSGQTDRAREVLERLGEIAPQSPSFEYAIALESFRMGDWEHARDLLAAVASRAQEPGIAYLYLGVAQQELGKVPEAEQAFAQALESDPALAGAVAYRRGILALQQARYTEALVEFESVVERLPGTPLADSASEYLEQLARLTPRRWELFARAGMGYDSNINLVNNDDFVSSGENGWRVVAAAGGSYQLGDEELGLQIGQTLYGHFYTEQSQFDQQKSLTWLWGNVELSEVLEADLRYGYEFAWTDWKDYRSSHNVEPALTWEISSALAARASFRFEDRTYYLTPANAAFERNGYVEYAGLDLFYLLPSPNPAAGNWLRLGYRYRNEDTSGDQFNSEGHQPLFTLALALPWQIQSILDVRVEWRDYAEASLYQREAGPRRDRISVVRTGFERLLSEHASLEIGYRYTNRDSNVDFFVYDRHEISFMGTYRY